MTRETYGVVRRPSFLTSFNRGRGPGDPLDPLLQDKGMCESRKTGCPASYNLAIGLPVKLRK